MDRLYGGSDRLWRRRWSAAGRAIALALLATLLIAPAAAFAQSASGAANPAPQPAAASPKPAGNPPAQPASPPASSPASPAASPAASAPSQGQPVGANPPQETREPISYFAYLLIVLAGLWLLYLARALTRVGRRRGYMIAALPFAERDRKFLSFAMPFIALLSAGVIIAVWGIAFLRMAEVDPNYTLGLDLFIICAVMAIATIVSLRGGGSRGSALH